MTIARRYLRRSVIVIGVVFSCAVHAGAQPDVRQMSGVPLQVAELQPGTVTVRVLRGSLANPIPGQAVEMLGAGSPQRATTNDVGRAEFTGLKPGARVKAVALVGTERLESQEFAIPSGGGVRLMLVAVQDAEAGKAPPGAPAAASAAQRGAVALGEESRFVFEAGEDGLSVFYILQIRNASSTPVQTAEPIRFELPADARSPTVLQGSSSQATVAGRELKIDGPFAPGATMVQVGYTMPYGSPRMVIEQKLPLRLGHVAVVAQKIGDMRLTSPQVSEQREMPAQGNLYIAGRGGPVDAGQVLRFELSGMPYHAKWPRTAAVTLAILLLAGGAWVSYRSRDPYGATASRRQDLEQRRDRLFDELAVLELRHRELAVDPERYAERRRELVAALQQVYLALDDDVALRSAS